jgi:hypothetical protein
LMKKFCALVPMKDNRVLEAQQKTLSIRHGWFIILVLSLSELSTCLQEVWNIEKKNVFHNEVC